LAPKTSFVTLSRVTSFTPTAHPLRTELLFLPTRRVTWGVGASEELGVQLGRLGCSRAILLTTRSLVSEASLLSQVERSGEGTFVGRFAGLGAHVPAEGVNAAAMRFRELGGDAIVSFGGGSVIDAAKAVAADIVDAGGEPPVHVALPTTLSGAEFSHYYGVTVDRPDGRVKRSYARPELTPTAVILDPALTVATPARLWSSSAVKALDHAIEGLLGNAPRRIVGALALIGIRQMAEALEEAIDPAALDARLACQLAAWECYFAPGALTLGLSHRIGHILGGTFGVPHGLTSCVTLAPVMSAMVAEMPEALEVIAQALDRTAPLDLARPESAVAAEASPRLRRLIEAVGLPTRLRELGLDRAALTAIAHSVQGEYPAAVASLGDRGPERLAVLLAEMW
jgi:maleylacetate reductase